MRRSRVVLHLAGLSVLALAHPVLDLVAGDPAFLAARSWTPAGALVAVVAATAAALGVLVAVTLALPPARRGIPVGVLALLAVLQLLRPTGDGVTAAVLAAAAALTIAVAVAACYPRSRSLVTFFDVLAAVALVAVPAAFLLRLGDNAADAAPAAPLASAAPRATLPHRTVVLVFDALGSTPLVAPDGTVEAERFPHLAELAREGAFYPDVVAPSTRTEQALPALLSGRLPRPGAPPTLAAHPLNLCTLLAPHLAVHASEPVFPLCPPAANRNLRRSRYGEPAVVAGDLAALLLHRTLPAAVARRALPPIDGAWGDFWRPAGAGIVDAYRAALARLDAADPQPQLHLVHVLLPHQPYLYLPSGATYPRQPDRSGGALRRLGERDAATRIHLYRLYLLQVGFVDSLVGEAIARLRSTGLWDRTLLVVAADHGGRVFPLESSDADLAFVPLFVKPPAGVAPPPPAPGWIGTVDLLPTLLAMLGIAPPPELDGRPIGTRPADTPPRVLAGDGHVALPASAVAAHREAVQWKARTFGRTFGDVYRAGATRTDLHGRRLAELEVVASAELDVDVVDPPLPFTVPADRAVLPVLVTAYVDLAGAADRPLDVVAAIDGEIVASSRATTLPDGRRRARMMVPPGEIPTGRLDLRVLVADPAAPARLLAPPGDGR